ncbi:MAG: HAD family hydrolase [Candidatus Taylorbacteria bacterium CG11_big_fil_rev_8_21_14_0_20_46_11]|uniref:HAD family hydrolase n=1 Tax=Candidatus Taylorbacteria bacterium CG11_big_fil_rev_8_21_14_0_20_46_11 TaxID=1975025 RepID=A0A2H0KE49_9BACT|nr:MAG: HAD family hydrolase [Candidatus Taylorbacteria bacterium CG11_big_fil_rev_8_21_14_0_20_46_11]
MKNIPLPIVRKKKLVIFDLDKTLAESKQPMDDEMAKLVRGLLDHTKVAVISGGSFKQFQVQFVPKLTSGNLGQLSLFPTCGSAFYRFEDGEWHNVYTELLSPEEKARIFRAFEDMFLEVGFFRPEKIYGELIEDRSAQVTFGAYGSTAPLALKEAWDPDRHKRLKMIDVLKRFIPDFEIRTGGTTSIDVTRKGIDKAHGIHQMVKHLGIAKEDMVFVGDDLEEEGNDFPVIATGVDVIPVENVEHTKKLIRSIIQI